MSKPAIKAGLEILASGQNIEALRRLIVMAIVGRYLMPASSNEEPKQDDSLSALLSRLPTRNLAAVASISKGKTGIKDARPGPFPLVVTAETRSSADHFDFEGPGVMIPMVSSTGHGDASLKRIHFQDGQYAVGSILAVVHPKDSSVLSARYLHAYLSAFKDELLVSRMVGTANVSLTVAKLSDVPVPMLPIQGQHQVDELMALCDRLEAEQSDAAAAHERLVATLLGTPTQSTDATDLAANWQRLAEHFGTLFTTEASLDALKQTILQLAVMGKLVPQDPNDEPASELLKRIAQERARLETEGKIKKSKPLPAVGEDEQPFALPEGWSCVHFDEIVNPEKPISYGVLVPGPDVSDGVPFVRIADLSITNPPALPEKTIDRRVDAQFARTRLEGGEILMGVVGSIGKLGVAPISWKGANIARAICRIVPTPHFDKSFLLLLLQSKVMQMAFTGDTRTLAQPTLNVGLIRTAHTPIPPLAEQHRIVAKVDELLALVNRLKAGLAESHIRQEQLADTLIKTALKAA